MTNADKFKGIFGIYATELWAKPEKEFLGWLNEDVPDKNVGDMISRQSAIDVTANATFSVTISGKRGFQNYKEEFEKACVAIRDKYIETLKALPSVQPETRRWIPCSERLPEPYAHVILTIRGTDMIKVEEGETLEEALKRNNQQYWVTNGYLADDGWIGGDGFPLIVKPIAWMEFPEPWKGEPQ